MKFALLGADSESCLLAECAIRLGHQLGWCGDIDLSQQQRPEWMLPDDLGDQWEALFDHHTADAVILGRGNVSPELRADQLNQLAKNGVAVLATFPLGDSLLSYYEIDMAREESGAVLHHFNPLVVQESELRRCASWIDTVHPTLGAIEQVVWERPLEHRTKERVLWHFARDVELLDQVAGPLDRLGALGSPDEAATYSGLSVQMLGQKKVPVRWSVGPVEHSTQAMLMLVAERGKIKFHFDQWGHPLHIETVAGAEVTQAAIETPSEAALAVHRFAEAVTNSAEPITTWPAALRAMELTDTIEISLRRGRMIDVHRQQLTEELSFKGTMSALGCGVLLLLPPLFVLAGWLAEQLGLGISEYWPHVLLALLAVFLLLQTVPKLLLKSRNGQGAKRDEESPFERGMRKAKGE